MTRARRHLLLACALGAAVCGVWWALRDATGPTDVRASRPDDEEPRARTALQGRKERGTVEDQVGVDPATGLAARAVLELIAPDGSPAAGVRVVYGDVLQYLDAALEGVTDDAGRLTLHASVVGRRIDLKVPSGPTWGAERFEPWTLPVTRVQLSPGCDVWLVLRPGEARLAGAECAFSVDGVNHAVRTTGVRSRLGAFRGHVCEVRAVGSVAMAEKRSGLLLPPRGSVDVTFEPADGAGPVAVRFRGPTPDGGKPHVLVSSSGASYAHAIDASAEGEDWVEFALARSRSYVYVAACGERCALGAVDTDKVAAGELLPPRWQPGCRLELVLPEPGPVSLARAFVSSDPALASPPYGRPLSHPYLRAELAPGWFDLGAVHRGGFPSRLWPLEPEITPSRIVWRSVPRGCSLDVVVGGTTRGTLTATVEIPADAATLVVPLAATPVFEVIARGADEPRPGETRMLHVGRADARGHVEELGNLRLQGNRARVAGFKEGDVLELSVVSDRVYGEATVHVAHGLSVSVPLRPRERARHRVVVRDEEGRPVPDAVVFFQDPWNNADNLFRTSVEGTVAVDLPAGTVGWISLDDARFDVVGAPPDPDGTVELLAMPTRELLLEFDVGDRWVDVGIGEPASTILTYRVVPGSVLVQRIERRATTRVSVGDVALPPDAAPEPFFERAVTLQPNGPTTLRVTR